MKNLFKYLILTILIWTSYVAASSAGTGKAAVYKVTMRKVEMCTGSTGIQTVMVLW